MRKLFAFSLLITSCTEPPEVHVDRQLSQPNIFFPTAEEAALHAGSHAKKREAIQRKSFEDICGPFHGPEYSGAIYRIGNSKFVATHAPPFTPRDLLEHNKRSIKGLGAVEQIRFRRAFGACDPTRALRPSPDSKLVAYWHTHPNTCSFSESDRTFAKRTQKPLYLIRNARFGSAPVIELLTAYH